MLDLTLTKVLPGHNHSHFSAEEIKAWARKGHIQDSYSRVPDEALLSAAELSFLSYFHEIFPSSQSSYLS